MTLSAIKLPANVVAVRPGSTAYIGGIRKGDVILNAVVEKGFLTVGIDRGHSRYQATLATDGGALLAKTHQGSSKLTASLRSDKPLNTGWTGALTDKQSEQTLKEYNFIFVVDHSGSMRESINPDGDLSKLEWLKSNVSDFTNFLGARAALQPQKTSQSTLISFSSDFDIQQFAHPADLAGAIRQLTPEGFTNIAEPLSEAMQMALASGQKELIVVLSDGMHNLGPSLEDTIISATQKIPAGQVVVAFLQVGSDAGGFQIISELDDQLTERGAKYDIVDVRYFDDLKRMGLKRILAEAVERAKFPR